jgi:hypothetical protein
MSYLGLDEKKTSNTVKELNILLILPEIEKFSLERHRKELL